MSVRVRSEGLPPVEFARQLRGKFQRAARIRAQEYARAYDNAWRTVLGHPGRSAPGDPPGKASGELLNAPPATVVEEGAGASGFRYAVRHSPSPSRRAIAGFLERGTGRMPARPFMGAVLREAQPEFRRIGRLRIAP